MKYQYLSTFGPPGVAHAICLPLWLARRLRSLAASTRTNSSLSCPALLLNVRCLYYVDFEGALQRELQNSNFDVKVCIGGITYLTCPASMKRTRQNLKQILHDLKRSRSPVGSSIWSHNES